MCKSSCHSPRVETWWWCAFSSSFQPFILAQASNWSKNAWKSVSLPLPENFPGFTLIAAADGFMYCLFSNSDRLSNTILADSFASSLSLISSDSRFFSSRFREWLVCVPFLGFQGSFVVFSSLVDFKEAFVSFNCTVSRSITSSGISHRCHQCNSD